MAPATTLQTERSLYTTLGEEAAAGNETVGNSLRSDEQGSRSVSAVARRSHRHCLSRGGARGLLVSLVGLVVLISAISFAGVLFRPYGPQLGQRKALNAPHLWAALNGRANADGEQRQLTCSLFEKKDNVTSVGHAAGRRSGYAGPGMKGPLVCPDNYPRPYCPGEWPEEYVPAGSFPPGFIWGVGTAAYQIEGGYREDGRGASIWDVFTGANTLGMPGANCSYCCKKAPCSIRKDMILQVDAKGATGNVACDHYHMWKADIALMKSMGLQHYRFSIAWPRIFPTGRSAEGPNQKGIEFYNGLINALIDAKITPYVTLYHWDLPQGLLDPPTLQAWWSRDELTGEPDNKLLPEWLAYVDLCFREFGDRVKTWFTFNEPWTFVYVSITPSLYNNHAQDPYIAAHNVLNSHAAAVDLYRRKYQGKQGGKIGIVCNSDWREPLTSNESDIQAAERAVEFFLGWFADPIFGEAGDYPESMRRIVGDRLPKFTPEQRHLLKGSADFFGLNSYGTAWAANRSEGQGNIDWNPQSVHLSEEGLPHAQSKWLYGAGWGLRKLLNYVDRRYNHPAIYITEGGWSRNPQSLEDAVNDLPRVQYYANYTTELHKAIYTDGVDVRSYFAWSLMDNFEWSEGYIERFGITYVDYAFGYDPDAPVNGTTQPTAGSQTRQRKESSCWLEAVWRSNRLLGTARNNYGGCVDAAVFNALYRDPNYTNCQRRIEVDQSGKIGRVFGTKGAYGTDCHSDTEVPWGPLSAWLSGGSIVVDFTSMGGPTKLAGYWNSHLRSIEWGDGSTWVATSQEQVQFRQL